MEEIRKSFHDIANQLNKISLKSSTMIEMAKTKDWRAMSEKELKEECIKLLDVMASVEESALRTGEYVDGIKKKVYELLEKDNES